MRMSWPVTVVPMFAPMITPTDCVRVIMPELTRPMQMTTVPAEDWMTPVMRVPKHNGLQGGGGQLLQHALHLAAGQFLQTCAHDRHTIQEQRNTAQQMR